MEYFGRLRISSQTAAARRLTFFTATSENNTHPIRTPAASALSTPDSTPDSTPGLPAHLMKIVGSFNFQTNQHKMPLGDIMFFAQRHTESTCGLPRLSLPQAYCLDCNASDPVWGVFASSRPCVGKSVWPRWSVPGRLYLYRCSVCQAGPRQHR